ncbi:MAG: Flp1 family type IVb pilin [Eubacteriales bacterium]|nr:Flp1 family type IVb pilin [Eubacteriales bacterium]
MLKAFLLDEEALTSVEVVLLLLVLVGLVLVFKNEITGIIDGVFQKIRHKEQQM